MNILIVEDDENKRSQIVSYINTSLSGIETHTAQSLQGGLREIINNKYDLIILDMTMPTFDVGMNEDGGRPQAYAGREILRQMDRRDIETPVIVVTQFDKFGEEPDALTLNELDAQLRKAHASTYKGSIYYDVSIATWKEDLLEKIKFLNKEETKGETQE